MIVLGIDPGLVVTGLAALDGSRVVYRGSIRTPSDDSDNERSDFIVEKVSAVLYEAKPGIVVIEGYEYQGPRTHTANSIRIAMLVGRVLQAAKSWALEEHLHGDTGHIQARVEVVYRTTWGHALGITTDASQERRLSKLQGLQLKNAHERDAACLAEWGGSLSRMKVAG